MVSIHAAQEGCDQGLKAKHGVERVSIHAAQAGCDYRNNVIPLQCNRFNSRSPSGLRQAKRKDVSAIDPFQFTQPKRAATILTKMQTKLSEFQFTQPKRAATHGAYDSRIFEVVSIHAAQAGCDILTRKHKADMGVFQFTQPKRAATP